MTCEFAFRYPFFVDFSLSGITITFLFVLLYVLRTWLGNLQVGVSKNRAGQK